MAFLCLIFFAPSLTAEAASSGSCGDNLSWTLNASGVLTISGTGKMTDYGSYGDTVSPWDSYEVKNIVINSGVTSIGNYAFRRCIYATSATIPESVTSIGEYAFQFCGSLSSIKLNKVEEIGKYAFADCTGLSSVDLSSVKTIAERAFWLCWDLMSVSFSNCLTSVSTGAFKDCPDSMIVNFFGSELEWNAVEIEDYNEPLIGKEPQYLYSIIYVLDGGTNAAGNPSSYSASQSLTLQNPTRSGYVFAGWYSDPYYNTKVNGIPAGSTGEKTFYAKWRRTAGVCGSSMSWILNDDGVMTIDGSGNMSNYTAAGVPYIEYKQSISQVVFDYGITSIGDCAFYNCQKLTSVTIPYTMKSIGSKAFYGCSGLKSIRVPSSVTSIGSDAFGLVVSNDLLKNYSCIPVIYFGGTKAAWDQIGYKLRPDQIVFFNVNSSVIPQTPASFKLSAETYTYTGEEIRPKVAVYNKNGGIISDSLCAVAYSDNKNAGTAKVKISFTNCNVEKTLTFKIVKAANPMTAKGRTVTLRAGKVSVSSRTINQSKAITIKNRVGTLSYKLYNVPARVKSYFRLNAKTGKITVKKGLPAGTYKVKVKVKDAGNENYQPSAVKTVTVKITVK